MAVKGYVELCQIALLFPTMKPPRRFGDAIIP